jgi:hydroxymethylpyrimidine pyrophosphatase-like HAD family hydrolase
MYKLVAIDIDGTLLNSYGEVDEKDKEAIKLAIEKDVKVVLTSRKNAGSNKINCGGNWCK